jgi:hypothetical protein
MIRRIFLGVTLALLAGMFVPAYAQSTAGYLDDFIAHVKGDKRTQYDELVKKMVAANRANKGDHWIAMEMVYGEGNNLRFTSFRNSYADIEKAQGAFMGALMKSMGGPAGAGKLFSDLGSCTESTQGIIRLRRWDLSSAPPADAAAEANVIGNTRWIRTIVVHVRPGMGPRYEGMLKTLTAAAAKGMPGVVTWVSQSVAGDQGIVYYIAQLRPSMAGFDGGMSMQQMLGDATFAAYQKDVSEVVSRTDVYIYSILPALSNPTDEVVAVAPEYWRPKPPAPPKPKTNPPAK